MKPFFYLCIKSDLQKRHSKWGKTNGNLKEQHLVNTVDRVTDSREVLLQFLNWSCNIWAKYYVRKQLCHVFQHILDICASIFHSNSLHVACNIPYCLYDTVSTVHGTFSYIRCFPTCCKASQGNFRCTQLVCVVLLTVFTRCCSFKLAFISLHPGDQPSFNEEIKIGLLQNEQTYSSTEFV